MFRTRMLAKEAAPAPRWYTGAMRGLFWFCTLVTLAGCDRQRCVDTDPPSSTNVFSMQGNFDGSEVDFLVNDITRHGDDEPTEHLGRIDPPNLEGGLIEVIVAVGDEGVAVVDLRGVELGQGVYEISPGSIGLSFTGEHGGAATSGTFTVDATGGSLNSVEFDVDMDGRAAAGSVNIREDEEEGGCV